MEGDAIEARRIRAQFGTRLRQRAAAGLNLVRQIDAIELNRNSAGARESLIGNHRAPPRSPKPAEPEPKRG